MQKAKYLIYTLIIPVLFLSCTDYNIVNELKDIVLTPEEFVSIAYDNPRELTPEEISDAVVNFQNNIEIGKSIAARSAETTKVSIRKKYYITEENNRTVDVANLYG